MNYRLYLWCVAISIGIIPAADAYSPTDLQTLLSSNKCVGCDLSGVDLSQKQLVNVDLQAANLIGANLARTNLTNANLGGANLTGANLTNANFTGAVLQAASLVNVNFTSTNLTRTDLSYANLVNTNFRSAILTNTDLAGANLALADFTGANLSSTSLISANLIGAKGVNPPATNDLPASTPENSRDGIRQPRIAPSDADANVNESSPTFRRPPPYKIPLGLGSPKRLVPGGTRVSEPLPSSVGNGSGY